MVKMLFSDFFFRLGATANGVPVGDPIRSKAWGEVASILETARDYLEDSRFTGSPATMKTEVPGYIERLFEKYVEAFGT
ncbi:MAG: hypothetical protein JSV63_02040 [Candidatus Aenigmatarchaeota archaeon]|nr:MAG: hypothetical protein JSV63_02040 [Candidatus Aenigmarchaeota archaeon]